MGTISKYSHLHDNKNEEIEELCVDEHHTGMKNEHLKMFCHDVYIIGKNDSNEKPMENIRMINVWAEINSINSLMGASCCDRRWLWIRIYIYIYTYWFEMSLLSTHCCCHYIVSITPYKFKWFENGKRWENISRISYIINKRINK